MEARAAEDCFFEDDETAACVDEAHRHGLRVCSHARAKDSISQCVRHGVDIIYHGSYIDEPTMDELERKKHRHIVAPGINWLYATVHEAAPFGYSFDQAEQAGYKKELEIAIRACKEMHQRGITVLPGGDYGFAWTPHGTYARDIEHFVKLLDFTPMEAILSATAGVAKLFMQEDELGKVQPGYFADMILVDGNPLEDIAILQDHSKLNVIMINGRIHKASPSDIQLSGDSFTNGISTVKPTQRFCNYVAYLDNLERSRIGHLDFDSLMITPIAMLSGAPVTSIYQIIELDGAVVAFGESFPSSSVSMQAPISDRDILAVGKNYTDHALEYNRSGYDLIDKNIQPDYPIIFTKRSTSIIGCGQQIRTHSGFTNTLDYEGEIGVIIGKTGFRVSEKDAMEYVWGYTLINDITARERQRDHKQFYIGKSADTFCPMGPVAVPADNLPKNIRLQTFVNGEKRQDAELNDLIFSIPELIKVISEGQTIRPGDIIATGTPAGVGLGQKPPQYLKSGDQVEIAATGLGRLQNRVVDHHDEKGLKTFVALDTHLSTLNLECTAGGSGLTKIGNKMVHLRKVGNGPKIGVFVHGLGASSEFYTPIIKNGDFEECYTSYLYDLEGHGLSPTNIESVVSIESLAGDLKNVVQHTGASQITLFGHSLGCVIAQAFCMKNIDKVEKMVLMGPPPLPLPKPAKSIMATRAATVRDMGMLKSGAADTVSNLGTSTATKMYNPVAIAALRASLLATNPEGYAKACSAVASVNSQFDVEKFKIPILLIAADEDKTSPVQAVRDLHARISSSRMEILNCTGHWHVYENPEGVNRLIRSFL
ncbi:hypothetical protein N7456_005632 [Penicillium angulare]|uniref:Uncharacterized protein n=1 Tax=Penicillium angulare TaxID=116970 RepID=A0A9W9FYW3_9EURO|nr:hypothetical protein N7456_005632 [Penicillium angulare]